MMWVRLRETVRQFCRTRPFAAKSFAIGIAFCALLGLIWALSQGREEKEPSYDVSWMRAAEPAPPASEAAKRPPEWPPEEKIRVSADWDILGFRLGTQVPASIPGYSLSRSVPKLICDTQLATTHLFTSEKNADQIEFETISLNGQEIVSRIKREARFFGSAREIERAAIDKYGLPESNTDVVTPTNSLVQILLSWGDPRGISLSYVVDSWRFIAVLENEEVSKKTERRLEMRTRQKSQHVNSAEFLKNSLPSSNG